MGIGGVLKALSKFFSGGHGDVKSFDEIEQSGRIAGRSEGGVKEIPASKIVGSVGRAQNLRSDFFYKTGKVTARFTRIGKAMEEGKVLPPIEVYKVKPEREVGPTGEKKAVTEYYVVDGNHRVAMAKKLGQDYLDAHIVEYKLRPGETPPGERMGSEAAPDETASKN